MSSIKEPMRVVVTSSNSCAQNNFYREGLVSFFHEKKRDWSICFNFGEQNNRTSIEELRLELELGLNGVIFDTYPNIELVRFAKRKNLKMVFLDSVGLFDRECDGISATMVQADEKVIAKQAFNFMVRHGDTYESFVYAEPHNAPPWSKNRKLHMLDVFKRHGVKYQSLTLPEDRDLLRLIQKPCAIIAANDKTAYSISEFCHLYGIRIPQEVAVLGIDNMPYVCLYTHTPLSSLQPDFRSAGYLAAKQMDTLLHGKTTHKITTYGVLGITERQSTSTPSPTGRLVLKANSLITENAKTHLTVARLAKLMKISTRLLESSYQQIKGITVLEAIHNARLNEVKHLITGSHLSLGEIATQCGFSDGATLKKLFKRKYGMSMREWRNLNSNNTIKID